MTSSLSFKGILEGKKSALTLFIQLGFAGVVLSTLLFIKLNFILALLYLLLFIMVQGAISCLLNRSKFLLNENFNVVIYSRSKADEIYQIDQLVISVDVNRVDLQISFLVEKAPPINIILADYPLFKIIPLLGPRLQLSRFITLISDHPLKDKIDITSLQVAANRLFILNRVNKLISTIKK